jgi:hypothetical protein
MPRIFSRRSCLAAATLAAPALASRARAETAVDVELVLAVDVSRSVDAEEQELQLRGYAAAFRDPRLLEGVTGGPIGAIACTMFVWSDWHIQHVVVPWARLGDQAGMERFAAAIDAAPRHTYLYTSISGAIDFATRQFGKGFEGTRRVVDISGDGVNNSGRPLPEARDAALGLGIVLNGLAVMDRTPSPLTLSGALPPLDDYYREEVIGGPGAFLVVAEGFHAFETAVRRKIIREIAAVPSPGPRVERV